MTHLSSAPHFPQRGREIDEAAEQVRVIGDRYPEQMQQMIDR